MFKFDTRTLMFKFDIQIVMRLNVDDFLEKQKSSLRRRGISPSLHLGGDPRRNSHIRINKKTCGIPRVGWVWGRGSWVRRRRAENNFSQPPVPSPIVPRDGISRSGEPLTSTKAGRGIPPHPAETFPRKSSNLEENPQMLEDV